MITLEKAKKIIEKAEKKAKELNVKVCIAVVDNQGLLVALNKMDGAFSVSNDFSIAKAYTSGTLGLPTEDISKYSAPGKPYYGIESLSDGKFTTISGGFPIIENNKLIGGIGVGGSYDVKEDSECAKAGANLFK